MKRIALSGWLLTATFSFARADGFAERAPYIPEIPGVILDEQLKDSHVPTERKVTIQPTAEEAKAFETLLARLTSRDHAERVGASRDLARLISQGAPQARYRWLAMALDAQRNPANPPEATQYRLPRATQSTRLDNVNWLEAYCRFLMEQTKRLQPYADLSDTILPLFSDPRKIRVPTHLRGELFNIHRAQRSAEYTKNELERLKSSIPVEERRTNLRLAGLQSEYGGEINRFSDLNRDFRTVKRASEFHDSVAEQLVKAGFEVEPKIVGTVTSALNFVVKKGPVKARLVVYPPTSNSIGNDDSARPIAINVFPIEAKPLTASLADFVDPIVALRYDLTKLPSLSLPPLGIGAVVKIARAPSSDEKQIAVSGFVAERGIVGDTAVPKAAGDFLLPADYLAELQPQLNWVRPFEGKPGEKADSLRRELYRTLFKDRISVAAACGALKPIKPTDLGLEPAPGADEETDGSNQTPTKGGSGSH